MTAPAPVAALTELARLRGTRVVAFVVDRFQATDVYVLYDCLRRAGRSPRLDVVLHSDGGDVDVTRRIARLLHDHTDRLTVLVPDHARSAGTLLCLAAHELRLGPLARLGPIDPYLSSAVATARREADHVPAEDVRRFPEVAAAWFGQDHDAGRRAAFEAMAQRIFPATLTAFYRADRNLRRIAVELLEHQLPDDAAARERIVDTLVSGYDSHTYAITRSDAQRLGLRAESAGAAEERHLWDCLAPMHAWHWAARDDGDHVLGYIASSDGFQASRVLSGGGMGPDGATPPRQYWRRDADPAEER